MSITSSVGLISGINTKDLIDQLMSIEQRPKLLVQGQNTVLTSQQTALQEINAKLLVLKLSAGGFLSDKVFKSTAASSSNQSVLTATTSSSAVSGTYNFTVDRLVSTQQIISAGFADTESTAMGGGDLTFEFGDARLDSDMALSHLNGGNGVTRGKIRISDRSGASTVVDLSKALTVSDVLGAINNASGVNVTARIDGDRFVIEDNTGATVTALAVTDVANSGTAASLGLNVAAVEDTLTGAQVNKVSRNTRLDWLNDGNGVQKKTGQKDFEITRRDGTSFQVDIGSATTLGDVADAINAAATAAGGNLTASINSDGTGLQLVDTSVDNGSTLGVTALNGSKAASDLGLLTTDADGDGTLVGGRVIAGMNSKLLKNLNGGSGVALGTISITNRAGANFTVDLASAQSIAEVVDRINAAGQQAGRQISASLNSAGNGLSITDGSGGLGNLTISGQGTEAGALNIAVDDAVSSVNSGNLQMRYISESTRLTSLNGGMGIVRGKFKLTDSSGATAVVDLTQGDEVTMGDVIREINSRGLAINARINDDGDGILLEDTGSGSVKVKVEEQGATTARDLGILGEAKDLGEDLNGSFEKTITIDATATLQDVADAISAAGIGVKAQIMNDGTGANPFRLSLLSTRSGRAGAYVFDDGGMGLGATTLVEAKDAVVFFGSADAAKAVAITSASNTLNSVIPGATISLHNTSPTPVELNISRNDTAITDAMKKFVENFNAVITTLDKYDSYDTEAKKRGLLLGDSTVSRIRSSLYQYVNGRSTEVTGRYTALSQIGLTVVSGAKLSFNIDTFNKAMEQDSSAVEQLFTLKTIEEDEDGKQVVTAAGIGVRIDEMLDDLTNGQDGVLKVRNDSIKKQIELGQARIEQLDKLLASKRQRLEAQFSAMETTLASLQNQSNALASLAALAAG